MSDNEKSGPNPAVHQNRAETEEIHSESASSQQQLLERERELLTLMNNLPGMAYRCLNDDQWTMKFVSEGCKALTGYEPADLIDNRKIAYADLMSSENRERVRGEVQSALERGEPFQMTYRIINAEGHERWVWEKGRLAPGQDEETQYLEGFITDVTDRVRAERELQAAHDELENRIEDRTAELQVTNAMLEESERRFRQMLENVQLLAVIVDDLGDIYFANDYLAQLVGFERKDDLLGLNWFEHFIPDDIEENIRDVHRDCMDPSTIRTYWENDILTKDGRRRLIAWHNTILPGPNGQVIGATSIGVDITDARQAEQRLQASEARFRALLESAPDATILANPRGSIELVNHQAVEMFGYQPDELIGQPIEYLIPERFKERHDEHYRNCFGSPSARPMGSGLDLFARRKGGSEVPIEISLSPVETEEGVHVMAAVRDITERKKAAEVVESRVRELSALSELKREALSGMSLEQLEQNVVASVAGTLKVEFCKIVELLPDQGAALLRAGVGWKESAAGQLRFSLEENTHLRHVLESEAPVMVENFEIENRFNPSELVVEHGVSSGLCVPIHLTHGIYGIMCAHSTRRRAFTSDNIDFMLSVASMLGMAIERQQAEESLRESEERYRLAVSGAREGMWDWNLESNEMYLSPEAEVIMGFAAGGDRPFDERMEKIHPDDRQQVRRAMDEHLEGKTPHYESEFRLRMPDDSYRWFHSRGIALRDTEGKATRMAGTFTDTTAEHEQFQKEIVDPLQQLSESSEGEAPEDSFCVPNPREELHAIGDYLRSIMSSMERTREKLQTAEQLASVGRLAASVAHEIRNPLTSIRMRIFSMSQSVIADPDFDDDYEIVVAEIERLEGMVNDFLEFSRPRALHLETFDLGAFLENVIELASPAAEENRTAIVLREMPIPVSLEADPDQLRQVMLNLLRNAMEAIGYGGEIRVSAGLRISDDGEDVIIRIQDTGPGISEDYAARLFEPFFTTKADGTGLGLCISAQIMERHAGTLKIDKTSEMGTVFAIELPVQNPESVPPSR